ncbi:hypothetical protein C4J81_14185 [Deltaproteobacteria bacterium Smac51]|nr:hypothetical protein C4J81_14185 [Deltaproteobacteria bacterium Smac51]
MGEQTGGNAFEQAAGAEAYVESAADGGGINLDDLGPPRGSVPGFTAPDNQQPVEVPRELRNAIDEHNGPPHEALTEAARNRLGEDPLSHDFPAGAMGEPHPQDQASPVDGIVAPTAPMSAGDRKKWAVVLQWLKVFLNWIVSKYKAIPPLEDIFDRAVFSMGMQRKPGSMLKRANSLAHKGRLVEAVRWYRDLLVLRPLSIQAYDGLGRAYFRMGLTEEANREFTIADSLERILHNRDDIEAATSLALSFMERKQAKMSVSLIEPVLVAHFYSPNNSELLKAMGKVYGELRAHKKMYQVYAAGLAQYPNDYEFHILKGNAEAKLGNGLEAERLIRWGRLMKKLQENPKDPNSKMAMGELCLKEHKTDEGLKHLREAAVLLPENTGIRWRLFNLYQKQGNFPESLKYFLEIVSLEPENEDLKYRLADFYRKNRHKGQALEIYRELAFIHPREPKPHSMLGDLLMELGEFDEGQKMKDLAQTLEYGLKANPDHRETIHFMKYLNSIGQYAEAREWLERGLAKWPYHGELVLTKVKLLYNEYRYPDAIQLLKRLISVKPDVAEPHIWIAMCYQRVGDNMGALAEAQLATRLAPKSYTAHKVLGDVLKEQKKLSQANAAYEVAEMMRQAAAAPSKR